MLKKTFLLLLLLLGLGLAQASAQSGDPCDPPVVNQVVQGLIAEGFDCLEGAGPFNCVEDVIDYAYEHCPPPVDTTGGDPCDPVVVSQLVDDLIAGGFDCLEGAGPFPCIEDVFEYAFEHCPPPVDTTGGNPCDPAIVNQLVSDLIAEGFDCLEGAGPFDCVEDVFDYAFENCPPAVDSSDCDPAVVNQLVSDLIADGFDCLEGAGPFACIDDVFTFAFEHCGPPIDTTWGNPCDSATVQGLIQVLIGEGFVCLEGAGPFACADEVFDYAFEHCPPVIDTTQCNPCDSATVSQLVADLIAQGHDCLEGAGTFDCVYDVFDYVMEHCPPAVDTTGGNLCDSTLVSQLVNDLIADGFECLEGAGPFACFDDVFNFAFENCPPAVDTTDICDSTLVSQLVADLIAQGFECLEGAGPFACFEDVFDFAFENCPPAVDTTDLCDPASVDTAIADLIAQGYTCLEGAGPFECVHEVLCYAIDHCPLPQDSTWGEVPPCLEDMPSSVTTFQQFLQYIIVNCDSTMTQDIPACWFGAPTFATDEEFFTWIFENCPDTDSLLIGNENALVQSYYAPSATTSVKNSATALAGLRLSPNPADAQVEIRLTEGSISQVDIMDLTGRVLTSLRYEGVVRVELGLERLQAGVYMVRVSDDQGRVGTQKLVKQ
ncbi:MAG TPA: T9SS type A sorting domain-containing protein [Saprospiraceae bacterium]|nr:T9SS type A sorting domain-containing protein [Saprospiraceae bacterium]